MEIHIGDVVLNNYASDRNPTKISVVIGANKDYVNTVYPYNGRIQRASFSRRDVEANEKIHIIGNINIVNILQSHLNEFMEGRREIANNILN